MKSIFFLLFLVSASISFAQNNTTMPITSHPNYNPNGIQKQGDNTIQVNPISVNDNNVNSSQLLINNVGSQNKTKRFSPKMAGSTNNKTNLPGFPQYVNTGDVEKDNENYRKAKEEWIN